MPGEKIKLDKYGRKELTGHIVGPVFIAVLFFLVAGRTDLNRAWMQAGLNGPYWIPGSSFRE